jgi:hypothetical protein
MRAGHEARFAGCYQGIDYFTDGPTSVAERLIEQLPQPISVQRLA